ncbi:HigA family addiction module antitoxin [Herbiconiux sp.]|uniref:HigA family addiction module antitoxin n=1 Tax=Herbiconiux sp. TaxID=1871186 RepID=UPI0025C56AEF|nr:HigA family addiction module antitoxin [Herbiconiux sp.]
MVAATPSRNSGIGNGGWRRRLLAHALIHPGEILLEEFLKPLEGQYRLAQTINVPARLINEIIHGKRGISPDTAACLARAFGTSDLFWTDLQTRYDLGFVAEARPGSSTGSCHCSAPEHLAEPALGRSSEHGPAVGTRHTSGPNRGRDAREDGPGGRFGRPPGIPTVVP